MEGSLQVPGYTAVRRLGSADSTMWLGTDNATGQPVTLRLVRGDVQSVRDGLSSASLVMRALNHPHVVPFHDVVETPQGPVLILGAAEGGSLGDVLVARRVLSPGEMVTACAPIAEAVAEIHHHGIVHGAITPDDVVFDHDGRPMLAGIGLATIGARVTLRGPTIAPEVASGTGFTPAADVYSIAAMGVVALTGPISADQLFAASAEQLLATGVAPAAQAVITRAIGRNTGRRPDATTLVNALYAVADPEPVELVVPDPQPEPRQGGGRPEPYAGPAGQPGYAAPPGYGDLSGFAEPTTAHGTGEFGTGEFGTGQFGTGEFGTDPSEADELDDVTAYMRQTSAPPSGRRARRRAAEQQAETGHGAASTSPGAAPPPGAGQPAGGHPAGGQPGQPGAAAPAGGYGASPTANTSPIDTSGSGRRSRDRQDRRPGTGDEPPRGRGRSAPGRESEPPGGPAGRHPRAQADTKQSERARKTAEPGDARGRSRGRRPSRGDLTRVASVLVVLLLVAGAVVIGMQVFGGDDEELPEAGLGQPDDVEDSEVDLCGGPRPAPDEEPPEVSNWAQEVQRLYELRAQAFEELDAELLCQVYAPTSEGLVRDVELMQEYADNDVRTRNLSFEVIDAELIERNGGTVILEISDRLPAYQLIDEDGEVVEEKPGMEHEIWQAELVPIADDESSAPTWRFG